MSDENVVLYEAQDGVATLTLNRPDKLNAFIDPMIVSMTKMFKEIRRDETIRAVLVTGAGRAFCAGQDLSSFSGARKENSIYEHLMHYYLPLIEQIHTLEKPVIAAVNGIAAGAGASLALACDLRIMSSKASLLQAFSNIGLVPDNASTWLLARQVGYSRAYEIAIEGEKLPAQRCYELGLTNRLAEPEVLINEARTWATKLAQRPTYALGLTKRIMNKAMTSTLLETFEYEAHLQQMASESEDFVEGTTAFREKRKPEFVGR